MILIAECGSTKTDWVGVSGGKVVMSYSGVGFNPSVSGVESMAEGFRNVPVDCGAVGKVYFYGAGIVSDSVKADVCRALEAVFVNAGCEAESDMLAAARALFGNGEGIACIIGTGANTALCSGGFLTCTVPAGGYVLGDEGSGSWIGKRLLADYLRGLMPENLRKAFDPDGSLDYASVVQRVYRESGANVFLASLARFAADYAEDPYIVDVVYKGFSEYFSRNVKALGRTDLPVRMAGSVAYCFRDVAVRAAGDEGFRVDMIVKSPCERLVSYHIENMI